MSRQTWHRLVAGEQKGTAKRPWLHLGEQVRADGWVVGTAPRHAWGWPLQQDACMHAVDTQAADNEMQGVGLGAVSRYAGSYHCVSCSSRACLQGCDGMRDCDTLTARHLHLRDAGLALLVCTRAITALARHRLSGVLHNARTLMLIAVHLPGHLGRPAPDDQ